MLKKTRTTAWTIYLMFQAVGLFHMFAKLPIHYERSLIVRRIEIFVVPGFIPAMMADWLLSHRTFSLSTGNQLFIGAFTVAFDCVLFLVVLFCVDRMISRKKDAK